MRYAQFYAYSRHRNSGGHTYTAANVNLNASGHTDTGTMFFMNLRKTSDTSGHRGNGHAIRQRAHFSARSSHFQLSGRRENESARRKESANTMYLNRPLCHATSRVVLQIRSVIPRISGEHLCHSRKGTSPQQAFGSSCSTHFYLFPLLLKHDGKCRGMARFKSQLEHFCSRISCFVPIHSLPVPAMFPRVYFFPVFYCTLHRKGVY